MDTSRDGAFDDAETRQDSAATARIEESSDGSVQVTIPSLPQFIGVARQAVDALGEQIHLSPDDRMAVRLAVGEACNNAVFHAPPPVNHQVSRVVVACRVLPEALEIDVTNKGNGFYTARHPHHMPEMLAEHGRGMALMEMLMDSVEYLSEHGNTVVRMRKLRDSTKPGKATTVC